MSDIVERLRVRTNVKHGDVALVPLSELREAAEEITRLRGIVKAYEEGTRITKYMKTYSGNLPPPPNEVVAPAVPSRSPASNTKR